jgi:hypothetical protein
VGGQEALAEKGGVDAVRVVAFAYDSYTNPSKNNGVLRATLTTKEDSPPTPCLSEPMLFQDLGSRKIVADCCMIFSGKRLIAWRNALLQVTDRKKWFASAGAFALGLARSIGQSRAKHLEVNVLGQLFQGVSQTAQRGKSLAFIEKRSLECSHVVNTQN